jgi:hypothetical protein
MRRFLGVARAGHQFPWPTRGAKYSRGCMSACLHACKQRDTNNHSVRTRWAFLSRTVMHRRLCCFAIGAGSAMPFEVLDRMNLIIEKHQARFVLSHVCVVGLLWACFASKECLFVFCLDHLCGGGGRWWCQGRSGTRALLCALLGCSFVCLSVLVVAGAGRCNSRGLSELRFHLSLAFGFVCCVSVAVCSISAGQGCAGRGWGCCRGPAALHRLQGHRAIEISLCRIPPSRS